MARRWIVSAELVVSALLLAGLFVWVARASRPDPRIAALEAKVAAADSALAVARRQVEVQAVALDSAVGERQKAQAQARKASGQLQGLIAANRNLLASVSTVDSNHIAILRERLALTTAAADVLVATVDTLHVRIALTDSVLAQVERLRVSERIQADAAIAERDAVITQLVTGCQLGPVKCPSRVLSYLLGVVTILVIL